MPISGRRTPQDAAQTEFARVKAEGVTAGRDRRYGGRRCGPVRLVVRLHPTAPMILIPTTCAFCVECGTRVEGTHPCPPRTVPMTRFEAVVFERMRRAEIARLARARRARRG